MRILLIGPTTPPRGGVAHFTSMLSNFLHQQHTVTTWGFAPLYPRWLFPGNSAADPSQQPIACQVNKWLDGGNPLSWWRALRQIAPGQYDLIIWQWWTPYWIPLICLVTRYARRARITTIAISHQLVEPDAAAWQRWLAQVMLQRADGVVFLGDNTTRLPNWQHPWRVTPLPSFMAVVGSAIPDQATARQRIGVPVDAQIVLCLGFVRPYKGIDTIINAMAESQHSYLLLIAGEWWQSRQPIEDLIQRHQLGQRVFIHDHYIANEQIIDYLQAADLLVLPYRSGSVSGVATLAATVGLPIIASTVGAIANQSGVVARVVPDQPVTWQAAITQFFANKPARIIPTHDTTWQQLQQAIEEVWNDCNA